MFLWVTMVLHCTIESAVLSLLLGQTLVLSASFSQSHRAVLSICWGSKLELFVGRKGDVPAFTHWSNKWETGSWTGKHKGFISKPLSGCISFGEMCLGEMLMLVHFPWAQWEGHCCVAQHWLYEVPCALYNVTDPSVPMGILPAMSH